jgi:CBS domain-containing protein
LTEMKAQPWRSAWPWSSSRPWRLAHVASQRRLSTNLSTSQKTIGDLAPTLHRLKSVGGSGSRHVLPASASVGAAAHHLLSERLSFSLILRSDESLLGMVTERDLLRYATQAGDLSGRTSSPRAYRVSKPLPSKPAVVEWMTPADRALTVRLDDTLEHAVSLVRRGIWRHLPVVDYYGRIHSILDVRDAVEVVFGARGLDAWRGKTAADVLGHKRKRKLAWPPPGVPFEGWQVPPWDC